MKNNKKSPQIQSSLTLRTLSLVFSLYLPNLGKYRLNTNDTHCFCCSYRGAGDVVPAESVLQPSGQSFNTNLVVLSDDKFCILINSVPSNIRCMLLQKETDFGCLIILLDIVLRSNISKIFYHHQSIYPRSLRFLEAQDP